VSFACMLPSGKPVNDLEQVQVVTSLGVLTLRRSVNVVPKGRAP
jgi:hypothetical protein